MSAQGVDHPAQQLGSRWGRSRRRCACLAAVAFAGVIMPTVGSAATFTVTTSADSGPGSLRAAITQSNAGVPIGGRNVITFNIAAPVAPITPATDLPAITEPVLIDGLTQPGARANDDRAGFDAVLPIQISGTAGTGLQTGAGLNNGSVTINGLALEGFATGIESNSSGLQLEVVGSYISGSVSDHAGRVGVILRRSGQFDVVGGPAIAATTLVTDEGIGVRMEPGSDPNATGLPRVDGSILRDNDVGVELATFGSVAESLVGTLDLGSAGQQDIGVLVNARSVVADSAIAGNGVGVDIRAAGAQVFGNVVSDNVSDGIVVSAGPGDALISAGAGPYGNLIVDNGGAGVAVLSGAGTVVDSNEIDHNGGLGIDLGADGPTPNDPFDADDIDALGAVLPNRLQNSPLILDAATANGTTTVSGRFHGGAGIGLTWELFAGPSCDSIGYGEGAEPLALGDATTDLSGNASVSGALPSLPDGTALTATVTTVDGTSEFSPCSRSHPAPPTPPAPASSATSLAATDTTAPEIGSLRVIPSTFAVSTKPTPIKAATAATGTSIRFKLSEAVQVELRFDRTVAGRRAGGKCRRTTRANRGHKHCTRLLRVGTINRAGHPGSNRIAFTGRVGARALIPGGYRLTARAVDAAGNAATPRRATFTVVRQRSARLARSRP
jgi:hypothetical protein